MKPSFLGLLIASLAFGASTIYLAVQLDVERTRADEVLAQSRALEARVAELEGLRASMPMAEDVPMATFTISPAGGPRVEHAATPADAAGAGVAAVGMDVAGAPGSMNVVTAPEESEAFRKMMRSQIRAQHRRLFADLGDKLGLSREDANRLHELLTDQQMNAIGGRRARLANAAANIPGGTDLRQKQLDEVAELIGYDKIELYKEYQETLPARHEVDGISRQLEGADLALSASQRQRLVDAIAEERKRVPMPEYIAGTSREDHHQALQAWQEDYSERSAARARGILTTEQAATYDEYRQWAREMRSRYEARRSFRAAEGNVVMMEPAVALPMPPPRIP